MKFLLGLLLCISSVNLVNAACASYTPLTYVDDGFIHPLENILVEAYVVSSMDTSGLESLTLHASSVDYAGSSHLCKSIPYLNNSNLPNENKSNLFREFIKSIKLSMALGYKLRIHWTEALNGIVKISLINNVLVSKP